MIRVIYPIKAVAWHGKDLLGLNNNDKIVLNAEY